MEPSPGFLGTSRLVVGDQPALDGEVGGDAGGGADDSDRRAASGSGGNVSTRQTDGGDEP
ncbi:hypothetical protein DJ71_20850 [Halorubrum sp. E3]|nr:hypothetical protein DJ71_20850 [Halorubrum sp. E3]